MPRGRAPRALLFATGPWPGEPGSRVFGPTIRARQFALPLAADGVELSAVLLEDAPRAAAQVPGARRAIALDPKRLLDPRAVWRGRGAPPFDAVLGVGSLMPAAAAARFARAFGLPCWVDLFGDPLAEFHAAGGDGVRGDEVWKLQREALLGGDAFSVVSEAQADALLGMLLLLGRVEGADAPHRRIHCAPVGVPDAWLEPQAPPAAPAGMAGRPAFALAGTWTPWMDADAMGRAAAMALEATPDAVLVLCGGADGEGGSAPREAFLGPLAEAESQGRVVRPDAPEDAVLANARAVLLLDRDLPETRLGARNRLLAAARWGTAVVSTDLNETARGLASAGAADLVRHGDAESAAAALAARLAEGSPEREARLGRAREWLRGRTFEATTRAAREWIAAPTRWPALPDGTLRRAWAAFPADPAKLYPR